MWPPPAPCHGTSSASSHLCHSESVSPLTSASFEKTALASPSRRLVFEKRSAFTPGGSFSSTPRGDPPHRVSSQGEMSQLLTRSVGVSWLGHQGRRAQNTTAAAPAPGLVPEPAGNKAHPARPQAQRLRGAGAAPEPPAQLWSMKFGQTREVSPLLLLKENGRKRHLRKVRIGFSSSRWSAEFCATTGLDRMCVRTLP